MLEAQLNYRVEAHKCELGRLASGTLVIIGSGPSSGRLHNFCTVKNTSDTKVLID